MHGKRSVSKRVLLAALMGAMWVAGCGATAAEDASAPAREQQAMRASVKPTLSAGRQFVLALRPDGTLWGWGENSKGQLGDGTTTGRGAAAQVQVLPTTDSAGNPLSVETFSAGGYFSLALMSDGIVQAWGDNYYGQLGDGTVYSGYRLTPVQVQGLPTTDSAGNPLSVVALSSGSLHSLALMSDGTVYAWGYNYYGQIGDGTLTDRRSAVQVPGVTGVVAIAAGQYHSLAVRSDGTILAWGQNNFGQVGNGTTATRQTTPVQVQGLLAGTSAVDVVGGYVHSMALLSDGTVWAWGYNGHGQVGDGTCVNRLTAVQVVNLSQVTELEAGGYHSLAVRSDGTVWGWGYNSHGELGSGTGSTNSCTPLQALKTSVGSITGGEFFTVAGLTDATSSVWTWGYNQSGFLCTDASGNNVTVSGQPLEILGLP